VVGRGFRDVRTAKVAGASSPHLLSVFAQRCGGVYGASTLKWMAKKKKEEGESSSSRAPRTHTLSRPRRSRDRPPYFRSDFSPADTRVCVSQGRRRQFGRMGEASWSVKSRRLRSVVTHGCVMVGLIWLCFL